MCAKEVSAGSSSSSSSSSRALLAFPFSLTPSNRNLLSLSLPSLPNTGRHQSELRDIATELWDTAYVNEEVEALLQEEHSFRRRQWEQEQREHEFSGYGNGSNSNSNSNSDDYDEAETAGVLAARDLSPNSTRKRKATYLKSTSLWEEDRTSVEPSGSDGVRTTSSTSLPGAHSVTRRRLASKGTGRNGGKDVLSTLPSFYGLRDASGGDGGSSDGGGGASQKIPSKKRSGFLGSFFRSKSSSSPSSRSLNSRSGGGGDEEVRCSNVRKALQTIRRREGGENKK